MTQSQAANSLKGITRFNNVGMFYSTTAQVGISRISFLTFAHFAFVFFDLGLVETVRI